MTLSHNAGSVLFIYDHSPQTGNGHLRRCEYFSKIFPKRFNIKYKKYSTKKFHKFLKKKYDYIITDSYKLDFLNEKKIKIFCKKLITIDDNCNRKFASDIIINYSPLIKKKNYIKKSLNKTRFFLGDKYNFIQKYNFFKKEKIKNLYKNKLNIFIYFGTKDRSNLIKKIIKELSGNNNVDKIYIVNQIKIISHKLFLKKIKKSDLLLISSGITLQEGLNMKKMIFATYFSKNQKNFYQYYKQKNLIKDLRSFNNFIKFKIKKIHYILKKNQLKIGNYMGRKINKKKLWSQIKNV